jgi:glycerate dehydrogenase
MGFRYVPLDELLGASDFVTIHLPLTDRTQHLINARTLAQIKPGAILVNTSRGPIVDTASLIEALADGRLRGAGLDVLEEERAVYHDFGDAHVIITPHIGWYTQEARSRLLQISLANVRAWMEGRDLNRIV